MPYEIKRAQTTGYFCGDELILKESVPGKFEFPGWYAPQDAEQLKKIHAAIGAALMDLEVPRAPFLESMA